MMLSKNKYCFRVATILVILTILQWVITYMEAYQEATPLNQFYFTTSFPRSIWFEMLLMLLFPYVILMDYHKAVSSGYIHQMMIRVGIKQMFFYSIKQITKYTLIFSILLYAVVLFNSYVIAFIQPNGIPSGQELLSYFLGTYDIPDFLIYFITTVIGICIYSIFMFSVCYVIRNRYLYVFFTPLLLFIGIFSISSFLHPFLLQFSWYAQNSEIMAMPSCILPIALFAPGSLMEAIGFYNFIIGTIVYFGGGISILIIACRKMKKEAFL